MDGRDERHKARMQRKKAVVDAKIAEAQDEYGLLLVHSGNGKGKSSSAFGMVAGRGAPPGLIEAADTVTEMNLVKHAFKAGVKAQKGVEF